MITLGKNIKQLRKEFNLNQKELADILGVSQTSIAHYEAGTRQPTIENLVLLSQTFLVSVDQLVGNNGNSSFLDVKVDINVNEVIDSLVDALRNKDEDLFIHILEKTVIPNFSTEKIVDSILKRVMYSIGDLWENGIINEADEHYATNITRKVLNHMSYSSPKTIKTKRAITLSISTETHTLGIEMITSYLESIGVKTLFLGGNLPLYSLESVINEFSPDYIFFSITLPEYKGNLVHMINHLNKLYKGTVKFGVGGQAINDISSQVALENTTFINDTEELLSFVD